MFDMHSHILPDIDDGAQDETVSLAMLKIAAANGTTVITATPHAIEGDWLPSWDDIVEKTEKLRTLIEQQELNIAIYPGAEVGLNMDILDIINGPGPYCINGGRYMLVELPAAEIPSFAEEFFFILQTKGISPILAHPERHPEIAKRPEILKEWIEKGILVQLNAPSLTGRMGKSIMATAELLLTSNMVHLIGSDAHGEHHRRPILKQAADKIRVLVGKDTADLLLLHNAEKVLQGLDVEIPEVSLKTEKKTSNLGGWLKKILG